MTYPAFAWHFIAVIHNDTFVWHWKWCRTNTARTGRGRSAFVTQRRWFRWGPRRGATTAWAGAEAISTDGSRGSPLVRRVWWTRQTHQYQGGTALVHLVITITAQEHFAILWVRWTALARAAEIKRKKKMKLLDCG